MPTPNRSPSPARFIVPIAIIGAIIAAALLIPPWQRALRGADPVPISAALRVFAQALNAYHAGEPGQHSTVLVLLHQRMIEPELLFITRARAPRRSSSSSTPPMPDAASFNYHGITALDAYEQRATLEQITAAADAALADNPWERIGCFRLLRQGVPYSTPESNSVIVAFAIHESDSQQYALIARADASVRSHPRADPALAEELTAATTAAIAAGVAPPPAELIEFANPTATTR
ncbi:MAG: hypothetical protein ACTS3F_11455 [Phycisphaerales bacterium]